MCLGRGDVDMTSVWRPARECQRIQARNAAQLVVGRLFSVACFAAARARGLPGVRSGRWLLLLLLLLLGVAGAAPLRGANMNYSAPEAFLFEGG